MSSLRLRSAHGLVVNSLAKHLLSSLSSERKYKGLSIEKVNCNSLGVGYFIISLNIIDKMTTYIVLLNSNLSYDDIDSESVHVFLEALSCGIVIDLFGSIIIESLDRLLYADIISGALDRLNTKFMHVSSTGAVHIWSYGRAVQSSQEPTWFYMTNLQLCSSNMSCITHFHYMQDKEQIVFVERSNYSDNDSSSRNIDCPDSLVLCSLDLSVEEDGHIQFSKTISIGQFPSVQQIHCQATDSNTSATAIIWVVCTNHEVYRYDYAKNRTLGFSLQAFTKYHTEHNNPPLLSAIYSDNNENGQDGDDAEHMLYILYRNILYIIKARGCQHLYLHCAFNFSKVLQAPRANSKLQQRYACVQDFCIASTVNNIEVMVLLTTSRLHVVRLLPCTEPAHSVLIGEVLFPFLVQHYVTLSLPAQGRSAREEGHEREESGMQRRWGFLPEIPLSVSPISTSVGPLLVLTCGRGIYGLYACIPPGRSNSWSKEERDMQMWNALFPAQPLPTTQLSDSFALHTTTAVADIASVPLYTYKSLKDFKTSLREYLNPSSIRRDVAIPHIWQGILEENRSSEEVERSVLAWCARKYEASELSQSGDTFPLTLAGLNTLIDFLAEQQQRGGSGRAVDSTCIEHPSQDIADCNAETGWLEPLNPTTLAPLPEVVRACTSEEVARLVDPLLLLTIVTALQNHSPNDGVSSDETPIELSSEMTGKMYVFLVLRVIFWLKPSFLVGFAQYLQQHPKQGASHAAADDSSPRSLEVACKRHNRVSHVPSNIRTLLGVPPVSTTGSFPVSHPERYETVMDEVHEEDDEIFGLSSHLREVRPSLPLRSHFIPHVYGQHGQLNISSSVCMGKDGMVLKDEEQYGVKPGSKSRHNSASEDSGDDVYGIFRDVGEEEEEENAESSAGTIIGGSEVRKHRLLSAVLPLLSKDALAVSEFTVSMSSSVVMRNCLGLARSVLRPTAAPSALFAGGVLSNRHMNAQRARSLCQLLLMAERPVQAVECLARYQQYAPMVTLCLHICSSVSATISTTTTTNTAKAVSQTSTITTMQRPGSRKVGSDKIQQQEELTSRNSAGKSVWQTLLSYISSTTEALVADSLYQAVVKLTSDSSSSQGGGEREERVITLSQLQLVEAIVSLKLTLKCLLDAQNGDDIGAEQRIRWIAQLLRCRPMDLELSVLRSWVTVHASTAELRRQILCSQEFLP